MGADIPETRAKAAEMAVFVGSLAAHRSGSASPLRLTVFHGRESLP